MKPEAMGIFSQPFSFWCFRERFRQLKIIALGSNIHRQSGLMFTLTWIRYHFQCLFFAHLFLLSSGRSSPDVRMNGIRRMRKDKSLHFRQLFEHPFQCFGRFLAQITFFYILVTKDKADFLDEPNLQGHSPRANSFLY